VGQFWKWTMLSNKTYFSQTIEAVFTITIQMIPCIDSLQSANFSFLCCDLLIHRTTTTNTTIMTIATTTPPTTPPITAPDDPPDDPAD